MLKRLFSFVGLFVLFILLSSQNEKKENRHDDYIKKREHWINTQLEELSEDERIAQLFMVAAYSNRAESHYQEIDNLVKNHKIGGLIFFKIA